MDYSQISSTCTKSMVVEIDVNNKNDRNLIGIRASLIIAFCIIITLLSIANLALVFISGKKNADILSELYLDQAANLVEEELRLFFDPVVTQMAHIRDWSNTSIFNSSDIDHLNKLLRPILSTYSQITSIAIGDETGYSYRIGVDKSGYLVRVVGINPEGQTEYIKLDKSGKQIEKYTGKSDYDARKRPWYRRAVESNGFENPTDMQSILFTQPFILHTSGKLGISMVTVLNNTAIDNKQVLTFNLMLTKISHYTTNLKPSPNGFALVALDDGSVIGFPRGAQPASDTATLHMFTDLGMPVLNEVQSLMGSQDLFNENLYRLQINNAGWLLTFTRFPLDNENMLWIGAFVPEVDFLWALWQQRNLSIIFSVTILLVSMLLAFFMSRLYSHPLKSVVEDSINMTKLRFLDTKKSGTHLKEVDKLIETHERLRVALHAFSRYIPREVVRELLDKNQAARLGGIETDLTIMFTDIRGFTNIAEKLSPKELIQHMSRYFEGMMQSIRGNKGVVDKVIGDAIMAFWGAPEENPSHAESAVEACLECINFVQNFNEECITRDLPPLNTAFGMASGEVLVGNIGYVDRMNYTVMGDTVNLASRLESLTKLYGVNAICSETLKLKTGSRFLWRLLDEVAVKGKNQPVRIFELMGYADRVSESNIKFVRIFESALLAYQEGDFEKACITMDQIDLEYQEHRSVIRLRHQSENLVRNPPGSEWSPIIRLNEK